MTCCHTGQSASPSSFLLRPPFKVPLLREAGWPTDDRLSRNSKSQLLYCLPRCTFAMLEELILSLTLALRIHRHLQVFPVHEWRFRHVAPFLQICTHSEHQFFTLVSKYNFATPKLHLKIHLIARLQKFRGLLLARVEIIIAHLVAQSELLDAYGFALVFLRFFLLFLLHISKSTVVYDFAERRLRILGEEDQIQVLFTRHVQCIVYIHDAKFF
mmetsp:Transcript_22861/g.42321  ORF Transcript_22861/g.42321 Transcript_22861/m.42321 type:complete len:214 (+) Transcript_22861:75-716(+)